MSDPTPGLNMIRTGPRGGVPLLFLHALGLDLWYGNSRSTPSHATAT